MITTMIMIMTEHGRISQVTEQAREGLNERSGGEDGERNE